MIPPRLTMDEIEELSGFTRGALYARRKKGLFPQKLYTTKRLGAVYNGEAVYRALGYTTDTPQGDFGNV